MNQLTLFVVGGLTATNILFYTAYSKTSKRIELGLLFDFLFLRKGLQHTLVEFNKISALISLALLGLAFLPPSLTSLAFLKSIQNDLILFSIYFMVFHTIFSFLKFYGTTNIAYVSSWTNFLNEMFSKSASIRLNAIRKFSNICATIASVIILGGYFQKIDLNLHYGVYAVLAATIHFYTMEIDFRYKLGVRPFGFLPFFTSALVIGGYYYPIFKSYF